jgi:hypothetical protein
MAGQLECTLAGAQTSEHTFKNNCGQTVNITFAQFFNGTIETTPSTWQNVAVGETKTAQINTLAWRGGTTEFRVTSVQTVQSSLTPKLVSTPNNTPTSTANSAKSAWTIGREPYFVERQLPAGVQFAEGRSSVSGLIILKSPLPNTYKVITRHFCEADREDWDLSISLAAERGLRLHSISQAFTNSNINTKSQADAVCIGIGQPAWYTRSEVRVFWARTPVPINVGGVILGLTGWIATLFDDLSNAIAPGGVGDNFGVLVERVTFRNRCDVLVITTTTGHEVATSTAGPWPTGTGREVRAKLTLPCVEMSRALTDELPACDKMRRLLTEHHDVIACCRCPTACGKS